MKGTPRFPGIVRHARELGVTHAHLYRVLTGQRVSPSLKERYSTLIESERLSRPSEETARLKQEGEWYASLITAEMREAAAKQAGNCPGIPAGARIAAAEDNYNAWVEAQFQPFVERDGNGWVVKQSFTLVPLWWEPLAAILTVVVPVRPRRKGSAGRAS